MSNSMLSVPGLESALASMIACRNVPGPESSVFTTKNVLKVGLLWLAMVTVAELIEPRLAPPTGWLSVRLKNEEGVERPGLARIGTVNISSVWFGGNMSVPEAGM